MKRFKFSNFVSTDRKILYVLFAVVLISIFSLTMVYAALSVTLNIQGNAEVAASSWDIYLDNPKVKSGSVSEVGPAISNKTTASFSTTLKQPGDFYEFSIDVVNGGTIDAMIESIFKTPTLTEAQAKYLNYIIEYENGESISTKQLVSKNSFVRLKVRIEYRRDIAPSDIPSTAETLNLKFVVNYTQSDDSGNSVSGNGKLINVISGTGTNTSDEVCIGEECFYVMYSDDTTVTALSKYNLYVGGEYNSRWTAYGDEATGKQDSEMIGWSSAGKPYKGTTKFSNTNYWSSSVSTYPAYVYNENSVLYSYVENYKAYLSTLGVTPIEARLITKEELEGLGCSSSSNSCSSAPGWVYATTYWSGASDTPYYVWYVGGDVGFYNNFYAYYDAMGCRPVIVISKDYFN